MNEHVHTLVLLPNRNALRRNRKSCETFYYCDIPKGTIFRDTLGDGGDGDGGGEGDDDGGDYDGMIVVIKMTSV